MIILAADRVSEQHIDYVYQRLDAKEAVASGGVAPATGPIGAYKELLFHRSLCYAVIRGFCSPLMDDKAAQLIASVAELSE